MDRLGPGQEEKPKLWGTCVPGARGSSYYSHSLFNVGNSWWNTSSLTNLVCGVHEIVQEWQCHLRLTELSEGRNRMGRTQALGKLLPPQIVELMIALLQTMYTQNAQCGPSG